MSAQAGIFYFDGRPIEPTLPKRLNAELADFGPDGTGEYTAAGLVMVYRALHVTSEDCLERQPYVSERGNVMTWDGRLDNREDLRLQLRHDVRDDTTDVALAMAAYQRWGIDAFARLVGDWSVAIFDSVQRSVVLASDFMGVRPMYYWRTDRMLAWSSSLAALVRLSDCSSDVDSHFVLGQLVGLPEPDLTPYKDIVSLSPAHAFVQHASGDVRKTRFWRCGLARIDYHHHSQYVEHFQHVFRQAVGARLRATRPVWCEVSGGLDSSSVACMAHVFPDSPASSRLRFVSYVNDASPESDERRFAEEVERYCNVPTRYLRYEDYPRLGVGRWLVPVTRAPILEEVARLMKHDSARVILTGRVGDATMGNFPSDYGNLSSLLATGHIRAFLNQAHAWSLASRDPMMMVLGRSLTWLLPAWLRVKKAQSAFLMTQTRNGEELSRAFSLKSAFVQAHSLSLMPAVDRLLHSGLPRSPAILRIVYEYQILRRLQSHWWTPRIVWSHPHADRQVVEFVAAIPFDVLCPPGRPRALMKTALEDILPARIHRRFSKGYAEPYVMRSLRPLVEDLLHRVDQLLVVQRGYVDPALLSRRMEALLAGSATHLGNLLNIGAVEVWLEAHAGWLVRADVPSHLGKTVGSALGSVDGITLRPDAVA